MKLGLTPKRRLATLMFPRYSPFLDKLNWNARWMAAIESASSVPIFPHKRELHSFISETYVGNRPVDYLEFGVYRGNTIRYWSEMNKNPESRFVGFDSFEGLPENWLPDYPKGAFDVGGQLPDIKDDRVRFEVGWFQNTLPGFLATYEPRPDRPLIVHNDSDLYSSTLFCLTSMNAVLRPGTVVILDDFFVAHDEFRALIDYSHAFMRKYKFIVATEGFRQTAVEIL
jgi:O-methyltransferase